MSNPVFPEHLNIPPRLNVKSFVSSALKLTVPLSLPYKPSNHQTIIKHFCYVHDLYPSIHPSIKTEVDSSEEELKNYLEASGTLPFICKNSVYEVPISIFLPASYPLDAPSVMIIPTTHMFVNPLNPHIDHFGRVTIPYTKDWNGSSSSLMNLCKRLSAIFSENPPVFLNNLPPGMPLWTSKALKKSSDFCPLPSAPAPLASEEALEKYIKFLENNLSGNVEKDIDKICESEDKANIIGLETTLNEHIEKIWKAIRDSEGPQEGRVEILEYHRKMRKSADSAVDVVVEKLDEAVHGFGKNKIPLAFNRYLSAIRTISRTQFYHRAYKKKIEELLDEEARQSG